MPRRKVPFVNGGIYHVFNKTIDQKKSFSSPQEYIRAITTSLFYSINQSGQNLSKFIHSTLKSQQKFALENQNNLKNSILAYCFMPNHFHLLLRQILTNGISFHLKEFQNSYTRFFNIKQERSGPLFLTQFKAVRIKSREQLIHVSRYIHLNPYSSNVVNSKQKLLSYPWSSLPQYLNKDLPQQTPLTPIINTNEVLSYFQDSPQKYQQFILDNADHQRQLKLNQNLFLD